MIHLPPEARLLGEEVDKLLSRIIAGGEDEQAAGGHQAVDLSREGRAGETIQASIR